MAVWSLIKRCLLSIKRWLFSDLTIDFTLILALTLFMGWMAAHFFIGNHTLYHDNYRFYGQWRDQLHSLNRYGEIEWWAPQYQSGTVAYYYAALGDLNCTSPQFAAFGFVFWLLGRLGCFYDSYLVAYVIHFAFIDPLLATLGVYAVARQLFTNRWVIRYAVIMAAFSPGVALNLSDVGFLEPTAYGLFFLAAYLYFLRHPSSRSSLLVGLSLCVLAVCLNYTFVVINLVFLPVCLLVITFVPRRLWRRLLSALWVVPWWQHAALAVCFALCLLPNLIVHSQGKEIVRTRTGEGEYKLDDLFVGNPLEALTASVPDFGYEWKREQNWKRNEFTLEQESIMLTRVGQGYQGLICIPLTVLALTFARRRVRRQLIILMLVFFGIVVLVVYSPFWTFLLWLSATLRANNHFSDLIFRGFGYLILILASSVGLQVMLESRDRRVWRTAKWLFIASSLIGAVLFYSLAKEHMLGLPTFGLFVLLALLTWCAIHELQPVGYRRRVRSPALLLAVIVLDLSTFMFIHINNTRFIGHTLITDKLLDPGVGFASEGSEYANNLMAFRSLLDLAKNGFNAAQLPLIYPCDRAHVCGSISEENAKMQGILVGGEPMTLAIDKEFADQPEFAHYMNGSHASTGPRPAGGSFPMIWESYNRYAGTVVCTQPCLLFIRDGFSPYWTATIDGKPVPIARAIFNFKAIPLPAGTFELALDFAPPWVGFTLALAYMILLGLSGAALWAFLMGYFVKPQMTSEDAQS